MEEVEKIEQYTPDQKEKNFAAFIYLTSFLPDELAMGAYMVFGHLQGSKQLPKFVESHFNQSKKYLLWSWPIAAFILLPVGLMLLVPTINNVALYVGAGLAAAWLLVLLIFTFTAMAGARAGNWPKK
jgi:hypothetical protein